MIQQYHSQYHGETLLDHDLEPFRKAMGRAPQPQDVPKTNANFGFLVVY